MYTYRNYVYLYKDLYILNLIYIFIKFSPLQKQAFHRLNPDKCELFPFLVLYLTGSSINFLFKAIHKLK